MFTGTFNKCNSNFLGYLYNFVYLFDIYIEYNIHRRYEYVRWV